MKGSNLIKLKISDSLFYLSVFIGGKLPPQNNYLKIMIIYRGPQWHLSVCLNNV